MLIGFVGAYPISFDFNLAWQKMPELELLKISIPIPILMLFISFKINRFRFISELIGGLAYFLVMFPVLILVYGLPKDAGAYVGLISFGFLITVIGFCNSMSVITRLSFKKITDKK